MIVTAITYYKVGDINNKQEAERNNHTNLTVMEEKQTLQPSTSPFLSKFLAPPAVKRVPVNKPKDSNQSKTTETS